MRIDLRAERAGTVGEGAGAHLLEEVEIFLHAAVAKGAGPAGPVGRAAVFVGLLGGEVADVSLARVNEGERAGVNLAEIIRRKKRRVVRFATQDLIRPAGDEPAHIGDDGVHVFHVFLRGIRVVHAQVAGAAKLLRDAKVQADAFGVADVQVAIRLGRKARGHPLARAAGEIGGDDVADEVGRGRGGGRRIGGHGSGGK